MINEMNANTLFALQKAAPALSKLGDAVNNRTSLILSVEEVESLKHWFECFEMDRVVQRIVVDAQKPDLLDESILEEKE